MQYSTDRGSREKYLTVIVQCNQVQSQGTLFRKYRKVANTYQKIDRMVKFLNGIPGGWHHANVYGRNSRKYLGQIRP